MTEKILLFITCYNCEKQIPRVLKQLRPEYADLFNEVLVVDNRSTDGTREAAITAARNLLQYKITVLQNDTNVNLGGSHKVAFEYAARNGYDYAVILHGDDQGSIVDVVPHLRSGAHRTVEFFMGARFLPTSRTPGYSRVRIFGNWVFNVLFTVLTGRMIYDLGAGMNVFKISALDPHYYLRFPDRLTFNFYFLLWLIFTQQKFTYFPLTWREEDQVSNARLTKIAQTLLLLIWQMLTKSKKLLDDLPPPEHNYTSTAIYQHEARA